MKYAVILIIVAASVVVRAANIATAHDEVLNSKILANEITVSDQSLAPLFQTLTKLVEGVLDGDKFVLDLLQIPAQFRPTTQQRILLKGLWNRLNKIKKKLLIK